MKEEIEGIEELKNNRKIHGKYSRINNHVFESINKAVELCKAHYAKIDDQLLQDALKEIGRLNEVLKEREGLEPLYLSPAPKGKFIRHLSTKVSKAVDVKRIVKAVVTFIEQEQEISDVIMYGQEELAQAIADALNKGED